MTRKVIQIAVLPVSGKRQTFSKWGKLFVLCDDGTMWSKNINDEGSNWWQILDVPQDDTIASIIASRDKPPMPKPNTESGGKEFW